MKSSKALLLLITILLTISISAQDGTLDTSFGVDGIVEFEGIPSSPQQHKSLDENKSMLLAVYGTENYLLKINNSDGSLDESFGNNGKVNLSELLGESDSISYHFRDFDILSDGKIAVGGLINEGDIRVNNYVGVCQLNSDGELNLEFGNNGLVKLYKLNSYLETSPIWDGCGKIRIANNDKIIVTVVDGEDSGSAYYSYFPSLFRLDSDGTYDDSFGINGTFKSFYRSNGETVLEIDPDGNIYMSIYHFTEDDSTLGYLIKVLENGVIDDTFASSGYFNCSQKIRDIDFQSDGKIITTSSIRSTENIYNPAIYRITRSGELDSIFGIDGIREISFNTNEKLIFSNTIISRKDEIISSGQSYYYTGEDLTTIDVILSKLTKQGDFDENFGNNGKVLIDLNGNDEIRFNVNGLVTDSETNSIIISSQNNLTDDSSSLVLARFHNTETYNNIHVSGNINGIWQGIDTVFVDGHITVPVDDSLTINPGTNVFFTGEYEFNVYGSLLALGSEKDSIFFFSDSLGWNSVARDYKGFWYGITFHSTDSTNQSPSSLNYCSIKYGLGRWLDEASLQFNRRFGGGLIFYKSNVNVKNTSLFDCIDGHNKGGVITSIYSSGNLDNIYMNNAGSISLLESEVNIDGLNSTNGLGIYAENSTGILKNSKIYENGYYSQWGTLNFVESEFLLSSCEISDNPDMGIYAQQSELTIERSLIKGNGDVGALFVESPSIIINCEILENGDGGLRFSSDTDWSTAFTSEINNCVVAKNENTGIKFFSNNAANITNCTIVDNNNSSGWGGVINGASDDTHLKNCIVYNNGNNLDFQAGGLYTYSIIQGNYVGSDTATTNLQNVDPLFRDAANGDYHLQSVDCGSLENSPGIDAGDPSMGDYVLDCATAGLGTKLTDIGAYGGEGNRWDKSVLPDCHFIGETSGTWECGTIYIDGDIIIPEGDTLRITEAVDKVLFTGPYQIIVEGVLLAIGPEDDRDETDVNGDFINFQGSTLEGNQWKGILFNNLNDTSTGHSIIENCRFDYADKMDMTYQGGGAIAIYNSDQVRIKHSVFYANSARFGGAIYIENSNPHIEDCYFQWNGKETGQNGTAITTAGGAMYIKNSNPYLHRLQFLNNYSISGGGAIAVDNSSITISNILLAENETEGMGGAIEVFSDISGSLLKIVNMTSADNVAMQNGGGTFHSYGENTELEVINSILYGNSKAELYIEGKTPVITYSIIESASTESYFGEGCFEDNPYFADGTRNKLANNSCSYSEGNTVVSAAIDAGHPDSLDAELDCYAGLGTTRADLGYYGGRYNDMPVGVNDEIETQIPSKYELAQNYPNPFNPSTTIQFALPKAGVVSLKIYNILGEEVATLVNREMNAGFQSINFDASNLSSGLYFYRISAGNFGDVKKMLLIK